MTERSRQPWNPLLCSYPDSRRVNALSLGAETLYIRLLAKSDDHGDFDGDPALLLTGLFGRRFRAGELSVTDTARMRDELVTQGLAMLYKADGEVYLHLVGVFKILRSDVKRDRRFPEFSEDLAVKEVTSSRSGHGPNAGR